MYPPAAGKTRRSGRGEFLLLNLILIMVLINPAGLALYTKPRRNRGGVSLGKVLVENR